MKTASEKAVWNYCNPIGLYKEHFSQGVLDLQNISPILLSAQSEIWHSKKLLAQSEIWISSERIKVFRAMVTRFLPFILHMVAVKSLKTEKCLPYLHCKRHAFYLKKENHGLY